MNDSTYLSVSVQNPHVNAYLERVLAPGLDLEPCAADELGATLEMLERDVIPGRTFLWWSLTANYAAYSDALWVMTYGLPHIFGEGVPNEGN